ncbi:MAG: NlpC/P60 family protein [Bacteroidota bacterium]|nr:NlpC/P60 family protein [Bacteroidota bacterium]
MNYKKLVLSSFVLSSFLIWGCASTVRFTNNEDKNKETETTVNSNSLENSRYIADRDFRVLSHLDTTNVDNNLDEYDNETLPEDEKADFSKVFAKGLDGSYLDNNSRDRMFAAIIEYLDTPYLYGGNSKRGIDCSAFTQTVFRNAFQFSLLRSARDQFTQGIVIKNVDDLQPGDLVFFNTRRVKPGHVGLYIGNHHFVHASSKHGVIVTSIDHEYYSAKFMGGRRITSLALN